MRPLFRSRFARASCLAPLMFVQGPVAPPGDRRPVSPAEIIEAIEASDANQKKPAEEADGKLDPALEAVARAWHRLGVSGAERECAARHIALDRLRLPAVIHLVAKARRPEVELALRRAWGEVRAVDESRLYVRLPVPAIRRLSRLTAVQSMYLDLPVVPAKPPSRESLR
jgi:hypothetical protein